MVGVTLDNGDEYDTRMVISNASAITTYTKMRDPDAVRRDLRGRPLGISGSMVYLGLDATPEELGFTSETNFVTSDLSERTVRESMFNLDPTPSAVATCYGDRIGHAPSRACTVALFSVQYGEVWDKTAPEDYARTKFEYAQGMLDLAKVVSPTL